MDIKDLDELLEKNFSNINSWLNFAEAKNAANIAFTAACITEIFNLSNRNVILNVICILLVISGMCSMFSFLPRLENKVKRKNFFIFANKKKRYKGDNLIFFENIKEYSGNSYIQKICKEYFRKKKYNPTKYELDLSDEIIYNSKITSRKYKLFRWAVYLDIIAFGLFLIVIVLA